MLLHSPGAPCSRLPNSPRMKFVGGVGHGGPPCLPAAASSQPWQPRKNYSCNDEFSPETHKRTMPPQSQLLGHVRRAQRLRAAKKNSELYLLCENPTDLSGSWLQPAAERPHVRIPNGDRNKVVCSITAL